MQPDRDAALRKLVAMREIGRAYLLAPREVAALFDVTTTTVRRWCDTGLVKFVTTLGGHRRIDSRSVAVLLDSMKEHSCQPSSTTRY